MYLWHIVGHCSTVTARTIHTDYVTSALLVPPLPPQPPPFFPSLCAYHSITLSTASAVAGTRGETLPLLAHAISLSAALMCAAPYSSREKPRGDSLGDRLITAFHQSPLMAPLLCNWKLTGAHFFHFYRTSVFPVFLTCSGPFFFFSPVVPPLLPSLLS